MQQLDYKFPACGYRPSIIFTPLLRFGQVCASCAPFPAAPGFRLDPLLAKTALPRILCNQKGPRLTFEAGPFD